ncbi:hypothetical protein Pyn_22067 [Prunus yedoensis var. nudiflora]|uniref:Uncharacterized protein n=1 Tax=Prunus yedoensis var. nudiflora TaxID=2094558 RepID=A0A314Y0A8_PRUYE|nr:hypothetical protein Pyn_22067 [Prunus yedoensis var. nudiflora]
MVHHKRRKGLREGTENSSRGRGYRICLAPWLRLNLNGANRRTPREQRLSSPTNSQSCSLPSILHFENLHNHQGDAAINQECRNELETNKKINSTGSDHRRLPWRRPSLKIT